MRSEQCCPLSQLALCHTEKAETRGFYVKKKKRDRCQNSFCTPNLQTAAISSLHPSAAENLMRSQSRVCPDHHFLPQPVTYLSSLIEFTRTQSASFSRSRSPSVLHCQSLPKAAQLLTYLSAYKLFYINASALVKDERSSRVAEKKERGRRGFTTFTTLSLINSFLLNIS